MNKEKVGLILTGGYIEVELLREFLMTHEVLWVIAVDKGLMSAYEVALPVDVIVGDFDSVDQSILQAYKNGQVTKIPEVLTLQPEKDMTDTEVALEEAIRRFGNEVEVVILGATGTRLDHTFANINLLMIPLCNEVKTCILDRNNKIYLENKSFSITKDKSFGNYFSLLPFTEEVSGLTLTGFKYPLLKHILTKGNSLGISNEVVKGQASVTFDTGILLVIESKD